MTQKLSKKSRLKILGIKIISSTPLLSKLALNDFLHIATFVCAQTMYKSLASVSIFNLVAESLPQDSALEPNKISTLIISKLKI